MKLLERLNEYLFSEYIKYDTNGLPPCNNHIFDIKPSFTIGTTKYYKCKHCYTTKEVYLTRWLRL